MEVWALFFSLEGRGWADADGRMHVHDVPIGIGTQDLVWTGLDEV